jgi:DNA-binding LacI/PurR family transcriptional regulator
MPAARNVAPQIVQVPQVPHRPSLIEHAATLLRDALAAGAWKEELPGERALSGQLQVSRPTLRAALLILEQEGWFLSRPGSRRTLATPPALPQPHAKKTIALLSPVPLAELVPFAQVWTDRIRDFVAKEGFDLQMHIGRRWWHSRSPQKELKALTEQSPAAVWVLFSGTERIQRWFEESALPCVTSGMTHSGIGLPSVDLDHKATCRHATGQLLASGHERIVFMRRGPGNAGDLESERGFFEAFRGRDGVHAWIVEHDGTPAGIRRKLDSLLRATPRPTGFLITHAMPALLVASELMRRGIELPREASLICRDTDFCFEYFSPGIARYKVDPELHARRLGRLVLECARGGSSKTRLVRLMPQFLAAESVGPYR